MDAADRSMAEFFWIMVLYTCLSVGMIALLRIEQYSGPGPEFYNPSAAWQVAAITFFMMISTVVCTIILIELKKYELRNQEVSQHEI